MPAAAALRRAARRAAALARGERRGDVVALRRSRALAQGSLVSSSSCACKHICFRHTMDHDLNVVGALVVALGDRMRDATEDAAGMSGALPAALASLHEWAGGRTVDTLAGGLRLSHSRTVRVVDRLEADGLAARERDPADGRSVLVAAHARRRAAAGAAVLAARAAALDAALAGLARGERAGARRARRAACSAS